MTDLHVSILPPGHASGHSRLWFWAVYSERDVEISGTSDDGMDAFMNAHTGLVAVMDARKSEEASDE